MSKHDWLIKTITRADFTVRSYSGRGMYGTQCLGFEVDEYVSLLQVAADLIDSVSEDNMEALAQVLRESRTDSMGRGQIVYFPHVEWQEEWDASEEDDYSPGEKWAAELNHTDGMEDEDQIG